MKYFESSAKNDIEIAKFFEILITEVYQKRSEVESGPKIKLRERSEEAIAG